MTDLGSSLRRWLGRRAVAAISSGLLSLALAAGGACARPLGTPDLGNGGQITAAATNAGPDAGAGGGGTGGAVSAGGAPTTTTTTTSTTTTTTTTQTGAGGSGGAGGAGTGGTGGTEGGFQPPLGSAAYPAETEPNDTVSQANPLQPGTLGFTASIHPLGDIDVFELTVAVPGTFVSVSTSDGMGGCPAGAHTYVRVFDSVGNVLALSDGSSGCASFSSADTPALLGLAPGKYYVHVESAELVTIPFYIADIRVVAPFCGDGVVQVGNGEQCDHGTSNGTAGDGCSATCQIESGHYLDEAEPDDTRATANDVDGYAGAVGQIDPVGDVDWYSVSVTVPGSSITAVIGDGFGGCPLGFDSELSLYGPSAVLLVSDLAGGVSPCSRIAPSKYTAAANLPVGKYALAVSRVSPATQPYYVLSVDVAPPGCGDGVVPEGNKQCDPGPVTVPGCSATCQLTGDFLHETEPNNVPTLANPLGTHAGFIGAINSVGDLDYFSFQVPGPNSLVFIQTSDGLGGCPSGFDSLLSFYDPSGNLLVQDDNGGVGLCSLVSPALYPGAMNLAGGTYRARVEYKGDNATFWEYVVTISVKQPGCGDGIVEAGEQCDDGAENGTPGDGCSATCQAVAPWEIRPNGTLATATPQWPGFSTWKGAVEPIGYHGYFTFTLATAGSVTLTTHDLDMPTSCSSDTVLHLDDHSGTELASDDDSGPGPGDPSSGKCSKIGSHPLQAGTYYAWVQRFGDSKVIPGYQLDLLVQ
jgi:cysteine-rich repeat protein